MSLSIEAAEPFEVCKLLVNLHNLVNVVVKPPEKVPKGGSRDLCSGPQDSAAVG